MSLIAACTVLLEMSRRILFCASAIVGSRNAFSFKEGASVILVMITCRTSPYVLVILLFQTAAASLCHSLCVNFVYSRNRMVEDEVQERVRCISLRGTEEKKTRKCCCRKRREPRKYSRYVQLSLVLFVCILKHMRRLWKKAYPI